MRILAVDPGTTQSGFVRFHDGRVTEAGVAENDVILRMVRRADVNVLACEMIACYGMAVGKEVFETCVWIGDFRNEWRRRDKGDMHLVYRQDAKMLLCQSPRAKDPNVRQALIDLLGPPGTKKNPGPTYGVSSHAWAALAVAVTIEDRIKRTFLHGAGA